MRGDWKLNVADLEGRDAEKLNHWALRIELAAAPVEACVAREAVVLV